MRSTGVVTLFGGTGFLGHALTQLLTAQGFSVRIPTRDLSKAEDMKLMGAVGQVSFFSANIKNEGAVAQAVRGSDIVINLIGELAETEKNGFQQAHVETPARLARIAKTEGISRFIHVSALGADPYSKSRYARTKAIGEDAVRTFFPDATVIRPTVMFGPRDKFFNRFAFMARYMPFLPLIGGGETKMQPVYVGDVASFIVASMQEPKAKGRIYALAGPEIFSLKEMIENVMEVTGYRRRLISIPWKLAMIKAALLEHLPAPPLTRDQVELLKTDHTLATVPRQTGREIGSFSDVAIVPLALDEVLPTYLA